MNNPRLGDVKAGLVIIIRKIMLRSKQHSRTEKEKEQPAQRSRVGSSDWSNLPRLNRGGSTDLNQQAGGGFSEKSSEKKENGQGENPPRGGGSNK